MVGSQASAAGAALSAFGRDSQHGRLMRLGFPREDGPEAVFLPNTLTAHEEVSRCFRFEVEVLSDDTRIPLKAMTSMSDDSNLNDRGHYQGEFTQGVGGWAEYTVRMTEIEDVIRHDVTVPPDKVIPVVFLPGVMGNNLRISKKRQKELERKDSNNSGGGVEKVYSRIERASNFLNSIEKTFHPIGCYASYCASNEHLSYGEVVFKVMDSDIWDASHVSLPPPESWQLLTDDAKGILTVKAAARVLTLKLQPANAAGDETVPSARSAQHIIGTLFTHGAKMGKGYEHQNSYSDPQVLSAMLYSIVKMAQSANWK